MKKRLLVLFSLMLTVLIVLTACGPSAPSTLPDKTDDTPAPVETDKEDPSDSSQDTESKGAIAVLNYTAAGSYFKRGEQFAKDMGAKYGYEVIYTGTPEVDTAALINLIQDMTQRGVKAICIASGDSTSVVPALNEARAQGIKVVSWDLDIDESGRDAYAGLMDLAVGLGEPILNTLVKTIGEEGEWAIIDGVITNEFLSLRANTIKKIAEEKYPNLKMVAHEGTDGDPEKAYTVAKNLMIAHPNIKGLVSNVSTSYGPAGKAIEDEGKIGEVFVCGQSTPNLAKPAIESGAGKYATLWDTGRWAEFVTYVAIQLVEGETVESIPDGDLNWDEFPLATKEGDIFYYNETLDFDINNINEFDF